MNGKIKFHKATGPAFAQGEVWVSASGVKVEIVSVRKYIGATTDHSSDYSVTYKTDPNNKPDLTGKTDGWNFQLRYTHQADVGLKGKK
jgi:hypothetical protein